MAYHSGRFSFNIDIIQFARAGERDYLLDLFERQRVPSVLKLAALRRRQFWAVTIPVGAFLNEFREGVAVYTECIAARDALLARARSDLGLRMRPGRVTIEHQGDLFYHQHAIDVLRRVAPEPAFFNAMHGFLEAAAKQPSLIKGAPIRRPFVPVDRRSHIGTRLARGPEWSPQEDTVLRQWFGQRTYGPDAGRHVALTEAQWAIVLNNLEGRRTKGSIRARLVVLNHNLKRELSVDGFIPKNRYEEYYARVLGENPRPPRTTPLRRRRA